MGPDYVIAPYILKDMEVYLNAYLKNHSVYCCFETHAPLLAAMGLHMLLTDTGIHLKFTRKGR